jgi:hypothetical protein
MFAIDGVKLPSNASKAKSGTREEFQREAAKIEAQVRRMLARHREQDAGAVEPDLAVKDRERVKALSRDAAKLRHWLSANPQERRGAKGSVRKSNRTDNESAKMATDKGVIHGYTGVAAVDSANQIIVEAQAHGTGSEQAPYAWRVRCRTQGSRRANTPDIPRQTTADVEDAWTVRAPY